MKKTTIQVKFDEPKAGALGFYMSKKGLEMEAELLKTLDQLYEKHVPKDARELVKWQTAAVENRPPRPRSTATIGEDSDQGGDG